MPHFTGALRRRCAAACATAAERIYIWFCGGSRSRSFALRRQPLSGDRLIILTPFVGKKPNFPSDIISPASIRRASGKKQLLKGAEASEQHVKKWPAAWLDSGAARIPSMSPVKNNTQKAKRERETHTQRTRRWSCMSSVKKNNQHLINCSQHAERKCSEKNTRQLGTLKHMLSIAAASGMARKLGSKK